MTHMDGGTGRTLVVWGGAQSREGLCDISHQVDVGQMWWGWWTWGVEGRLAGRRARGRGPGAQLLPVPLLIISSD